ncbi:MAG: aminopeptidase P N-terminal domain-containing protein [Bacteriovoracaceae bacterium]|nr:aminopeptidase P N-terminal domain-containing protein [Bacteriovoracaceae bacterium]
MESTSYKERRSRLMENLNDGMAIIKAQGHKQRSHDTEYPFRQDSNFKYLTGFNEPESILVLTPNSETKTTLFVRPKDELAELWSGKRMGVEKASELLEIDQVFPINDYEKKIAELMVGHKTIYMDIFNNSKEVNDILSKCQNLQFAKRKSKSQVPQGLSNLRIEVGKMRLIKDQNEIRAMKMAAQATTLAHKGAMAFAAPGKNENEVQAFLEFLFKLKGAEGTAYESIVAGGNNANTLHYVNNNMVLNDGDLLLIDAGAEFNLYAADVTRTFPVNGTFTAAQRDVYQLVLEAQKASLAQAKPGKTLTDVHKESVKVLTDGLIHLRVLEGTLEENLENENYRRFYPHGTSHWLGLDVHDESPYINEKFEEFTFEAGMAFTIEPGLYFPATDATLRNELQGIGIRIEDDILITESGHEVITSGIPKEIKEVEEACKADYKTFL